jgi:hypothetical protein
VYVGLIGGTVQIPSFRDRVFGVPLALIVCTLSNIPFVFGWFEFYFALYIFYTEYVLVIRDRLQFYRKHGKW